jgi:D-glycero-alpha-D-manno-heptose-7-phosphate kinase
LVITQTPLRVSFWGGGTDLSDFYTKHGGAVISATIDKYIYLIVKSRYDDSIVLNYSEKETVSEVGKIRHNIFREALKLTGIAGGVEITSIADIPSQGSGLGSSSSFTVGLLNALYAYIGSPKGPAELAELACHIEIDILGEPIGKQDQYAAAFGGFRRYLFLPDGRVQVEPIGISERDIIRIQRACRIFYTGITRNASSVLSEQQKNIGNNIDALLKLKEYAMTADSLLRDADMAAIGRLLNEGWSEKKKLAARVSNAEIDSIYDRAIAAGATGGKLLGAGGGGFYLFVGPGEKLEKLQTALRELSELPFSFTRYGSKVIMNMEENVHQLK